MKTYIETMKAGTTPLVVRLRVIFLTFFALFAILFAVTPLLLENQVSFFAVKIGAAILGGICAAVGPVIAIKDPAMTMKMLGGFFFAIYIITVIDSFLL